MDLERTLAMGLMSAHPQDAARVLEGCVPSEAAAVLAEGPAEAAESVLGSMAVHFAALVLQRLPPPRAIATLSALKPDLAAAVLRQAAPERRAAFLDDLPAPSAETLRQRLRFPEDTAAAMADPAVLALPDDCTAAQAVRRARESAALAHYNIYVVDREQRLVGVLNLRELLAARARDTLRKVMKRDVHRISATATLREILEHPGWQEVHSLPVVDEAGRPIGAIRYRAMRSLEARFRGEIGGGAGAETARALGSLFLTGLAGIAEAVTFSIPPRDEEGSGGRRA